VLSIRKFKGIDGETSSSEESFRETVMVMGRSKMFVVKRDGRQEEVHFDKITSRIEKLCYGLNLDFVDPPAITMKVINGLYSGVTTVELDNLAAETAATLTTKHSDYAILAARIAVSNLHKETKKCFSGKFYDFLLRIWYRFFYAMSLQCLILLSDCSCDAGFV